MEKIRTFTRTAAEAQALETEYETIRKCVEEKDMTYVKDVFLSGFKGYINFTDLELETELEAQLGYKCVIKN